MNNRANESVYLSQQCSFNRILLLVPKPWPLKVPHEMGVRKQHQAVYVDLFIPRRDGVVKCLQRRKVELVLDHLAIRRLCVDLFHIYVYPPILLTQLGKPGHDNFAEERKVAFKLGLGTRMYGHGHPMRTATEQEKTSQRTEETGGALVPLRSRN